MIIFTYPSEIAQQPLCMPASVHVRRQHPASRLSRFPLHYDQTGFDGYLTTRPAVHRDCRKQDAGNHSAQVWCLSTQYCNKTKVMYSNVDVTRALKEEKGKMCNIAVWASTVRAHICIQQQFWIRGFIVKFTLCWEVEKPLSLKCLSFWWVQLCLKGTYDVFPLFWALNTVAILNTRVKRTQEWNKSSRN